MIAFFLAHSFSRQPPGVLKRGGRQATRQVRRKECVPLADERTGEDATLEPETMINGIGSEIYNFGYSPTANSLDTKRP